MKKVMTIICSILSLVLLTSCKKVNKESKITLGFMSSIGAVPYIYALEEGFYAESGLNVEIKIFTNANDRDAALIGKHIDAVNTDYVMFASLLEQGYKLKATVTTEDQFFIVANKTYKETITNDIKSTDGAKVGTFENGVLSYLVEKLASDNDITYQLVGIPMIPARLQALESNEIDMAILPDPSASKVTDGKIIWDNFSDGVYVTTLACFDDYLNENKELVNKFFEATNKAIQKLSTEAEVTVKEYIVKQNLLTAEDTNIITLPTYHKLFSPSKEDFDPVMNWMVEKGLIAEPYNLDDVLYNWQK